MTRRPLRAKPSTTNNSGPYALPPPIGGWNARDALAIMEATDAERLENWFPDTSYIIPRPGSETFCTGFGGTVETMIQWSGGSTVKLLVGCAGALIDASSGGSSSGGNVIASGFTEDMWQGINFGAGGGNYLILVNGSDPCQGYNGTSASAGTRSSFAVNLLWSASM